MTPIKFEMPGRHIIAWAIFILYERAIAYISFGRFPNFWVIVAYYLVDIIFFYIHAHVVIPRAYKGAKFLYSRLIPLVFAEFVAYIACRYFIYFLFFYIHLPPAPMLTTNSFF